MRLSMAISLMFAAAVGACSVANPNHCANLNGHATCQARDGNTPYCSKCSADNDGCVAEPLAEFCDAGESSAAGSSGPGASETTAPTTTLASTSTADLSTSTISSGTEGLSTGDLSTTGTTSTSDATTTGEATGTSTLDFTTGDTATTAGPMCGDNAQELPEICDGTDLGQYQTCTAKNPETYGGGELACDISCTAYDETNCCLKLGTGCLLAGQPCCPGTSCQLLGMGLFTCKAI